MEQRGLEPLTSALRTRRSAQLSYCPTDNPQITQIMLISQKERGMVSEGHGDEDSKGETRQPHFVSGLTRLRNLRNLWMIYGWRDLMI